MDHVQDAALTFALVLSAVGLIWAAVSDLHRYLIPNRVCALIAGAYGLAAVAMPLGPWIAGLAIGALALGVGTVLFARGWVGGGDVKLTAAIALWAGPAYVSDFALTTSLAGMALAAFMMTPARRLMPRPAGVEATAGLRQPMPFGVPLAAGGAWVLVQHLTTQF